MTPESYTPDRRRGLAGATPLPRGKVAIRRAVLAAFIGATAILWLDFPAPPNTGQIEKGGVAPPRTIGRSRTFLAAGALTQPAGQAHAYRPPGAVYQPGDLVRNLHRLIDMRDEDAPSVEVLQLAEAIYRDLLNAGALAIPEALDFLENGDDLPLAGRAGDSFDFRSLRLALIDALKLIGGRDVEATFLRQLQVSDSSAELEALAAALDWLQPGAYDPVILDRALTWLRELTSGSESTVAPDSSPLFRVLQDFGRDGLAPVLQDLPYWLRAYADVVLANLPDGEGVEPLTLAARRDLHRSGDSRALHLLAQLAAADPLAEQALVTLALTGEIPDTAWPLIADALIGDRQLQLEEPPLDPYLIGSLRDSNPFAVHSIVDRQIQVIYSVNYSAVLSPEAAAARLALLDRMLERALSPAARAALWSARDLLTGYY